ncbi:TRAP transporter small permease subunit [bacterium]|nr:TRAP transporter small permease subunit [bacterium]
MEKVLTIIDNLSEWTGRIFSWIILLMTVLIVYEVIQRRVLNTPTIWNFEVLLQLFGLYFMILASYGLLHSSHVSVDFIYQRFSPRNQAILDIISYTIFFFPFWIIMLWQGSRFAKISWDMLEKSPSVFAAPLYPIKTIIPLTAVLLLLQGLSIYIRRFLIIFRGEKDV